MADEKPLQQEAVLAKPLLQGPKRQHFLPRFYLEGFDKDGMVAVYDRESNDIRIQAPLNTGVIGHFYMLEDDQGRRRYELEQMLSEFESEASPVIGELAAGRDITPEQRAHLAIFVALAGFRTPDIVDSLKLFNSGLIEDFAKRLYSNVEQVKEYMRSKPGSPVSDEELEQEAKEMVEFVQSGKYTVETKHHWAVGMAIQTALNIAPILSGRDWHILHRDTDKKSFVTTDAPVTLTTVTSSKTGLWESVGFASPDAMIIFPMTQSCALVITGKDGGFEHRTVGTDQIRHCNLMMADRCQRFVIGRDETLLRSLADYLGLRQKQWQPKMQRAERA